MDWLIGFHTSIAGRFVVLSWIKTLTSNYRWATRWEVPQTNERTNQRTNISNIRSIYLLETSKNEDGHRWNFERFIDLYLGIHIRNFICANKLIIRAQHHTEKNRPINGPMYLIPLLPHVMHTQKELQSQMTMKKSPKPLLSFLFSSSRFFFVFFNLYGYWVFVYVFMVEFSWRPLSYSTSF